MKRSIEVFTDRNDGAVAIIVAIALPVVLGVAILAIDYSMALLTRVENQRTADIAVYAAAKSYGKASASDQDPETAARDEARSLLILNGADPEGLTLNFIVGDLSQEKQLELFIEQVLPPIGLITLRGDDGINVVVRSLATIGVEQAPVCMYTTGLSSDDFIFGNNSTLLLGGCSIQSRGGFSNLPRSSQLNIGGCITQEGKNVPSECPSVTRKNLSEPNSDHPLDPNNPLGIDWADAEAECIRLGRQSTDLADYRNGSPIPAGLHCISEDVRINGGTFINASGGITLFFKPNIEVSIGGNPTFTLEPAELITIPVGGESRFVRNVLFYGPGASLRARGTMSITSLGCYGITMAEIDFNGNPTISLDDTNGALCDPERDLGIGASVRLRE